jgi:uncharacterized membrane protein
MSNSESKLGMAPNVAGLLCNAPCCIGFVFSIVAAVVEKENRFIKFHAFQSLLLHAVGVVCGVGIQAAAMVAGMFVWGLGGLISLLGLPLTFAFLGVEIFLMIKANGNEEFRLPIIGDMAANWAA